jgi:hypothetical protein
MTLMPAKARLLLSGDFNDASAGEGRDQSLDIID